MSDLKTNSTRHVYFDLLEYFAREAGRSADPILHPDKSVNKIMDKRGTSLRNASVLIPISRHSPEQESEIVLTVRSKNMNSHAGQISLPGGSAEANDVDAAATALRESEEEIGLPSGNVEVIGQLGEMSLPSGFRITPVVGLIEPNLDFVACPIEVAAIFQVPLSLLLNTKAYTSSSMTYDNQARKILAIEFKRFRIWGATAAILYHLAKKVAESKVLGSR